MHQAGARSSRIVGVRQPLIMDSEQLRDLNLSILLAVNSIHYGASWVAPGVPF